MPHVLHNAYVILTVCSHKGKHESDFYDEQKMNYSIHRVDITVHQHPACRVGPCYRGPCYK